MAPGRGVSARGGFTLVEMVISVALMVLLMSSAILAARGGMGAFRATQDASDAETRVRRALDRVVFELLSAGQLLPDPSGEFGTSNLQFCKRTLQTVLIDGVEQDEPGWTNPISIKWERASGEVDDGIDNDGNGLIDEGVLVLTRDVGGDEHRTILCHGVREFLEGEVPDGDDDNGNGVTDEAGFNVSRVGDVLNVRLSVEESLESGTIVRTLETAVRLRN